MKVKRSNAYKERNLLIKINLKTAKFSIIKSKQIRQIICKQMFQLKMLDHQFKREIYYLVKVC